MQQPLPYCVYVLRSLADGFLYTGYTTNLAQRFLQHNNGESTSTAPRRPLELIFCEFYASSDDAQRRERYLKTTAGKRTLKLMLQDTMNLLRP